MYLIPFILYWTALYCTVGCVECWIAFDVVWNRRIVIDGAAELISLNDWLIDWMNWNAAMWSRKRRNGLSTRNKKLRLDGVVSVKTFIINFVGTVDSWDGLLFSFKEKHVFEETYLARNWRRLWWRRRTSHSSMWEAIIERRNPKTMCEIVNMYV